MWLEADCNLSSGESLVRQILHGKRFMKNEFGIDSKVLWLPDVFITAAKEACDSEDIVVRVYESYGQRTAAKISAGFDIQTACETDLIETKSLRSLEVKNNTFEFELKPFEIKTFMLKISR